MPVQRPWNRSAITALVLFLLFLFSGPISSFLGGNNLLMWMISNFAGAGLITFLAIGSILPLLALFFAIKAIYGIDSARERGKVLAWIVLIADIILTILVAFVTWWLLSFLGGRWN